MTKDNNKRSWKKFNGFGLSQENTKHVTESICYYYLLIAVSTQHYFILIHIYV
jgi:hypothetical protein